MKRSHLAMLNNILCPVLLIMVPLWTILFTYLVATSSKHIPAFSLVENYSICVLGFATSAWWCRVRMGWFKGKPKQ
jgi:hypothetical protein